MGVIVEVPDDEVGVPIEGPATTSGVTVVPAVVEVKVKPRCVTCQGRLRPYVDPKVGAGAGRDYGVKPGLRCVRCGRTG